jgi:hypothetical protein
MRSDSLFAADLPQQNAPPSTKMRCKITANLRAAATRARATPHRLATFMPRARNADHWPFDQS